MPLTTAFKLSLSGVLTGTADFGPARSDPSVALSYATTDGTGANQADILWTDERTVASAANDDIDLVPLTDAIGIARTAVELVGLIIINAPKSGAANTTNLTVGVGTNPVTPGFLGGTTPTIGPIRPGGIVALWNSENAAGFGAVAAGTADVLRVANSSGASATYQVFFVGRSA